jgi:Flp pilus assembly protein TadD
LKLAQFYLHIREPKLTLQALDDVVHNAPPDALASGGRSLRFDVAQGRAAAWSALGDLKQATAFQEEAVHLAPDEAGAWASLAKLYQRQGRFEDEYRAEERARNLSTSGH